jgi:hypothetical protein
MMENVRVRVCMMGEYQGEGFTGWENARVRVLHDEGTSG